MPPAAPAAASEAAPAAENSAEAPQAGSIFVQDPAIFHQRQSDLERLKGNLENDKPSGNARGGNTGKQKIAHDLNLRFDFSIRNQSAIKRDLQTNLCEATSGSKAFKTSAQVDYTLSRMVTLSLYYDRQRSEPLLSSSSYPTITQDFGMSMKFSLTR